MNPACHRSLYSYQVRTALALAIEQPHIAVTLVPLACTGATIGAGMFAGQRADDCPWVVGIETCSGTAPAQFAELRDVMAAVHRQKPNRNLDMVLLTVGANDVNFAGLVANVIVDATTERILLRQGGAIVQRRRFAKSPRPGFSRRIRAIAFGAQALCRRQSRPRGFRLLRQSRPCKRQASPAPAAATAWTFIRPSAPTPTGCAPRRNSSTPSFCRRSRRWRPATATRRVAIRRPSA